MGSFLPAILHRPERARRLQPDANPTTAAATTTASDTVPTAERDRTRRVHELMTTTNSKYNFFSLARSFSCGIGERA